MLRGVSAVTLAAVALAACGGDEFTSGSAGSGGAGATGGAGGSTGGSGGSTGGSGGSTGGSGGNTGGSGGSTGGSGGSAGGESWCAGFPTLFCMDFDGANQINGAYDRGVPLFVQPIVQSGQAAIGSNYLSAPRSFLSKTNAITAGTASAYFDNVAKLPATSAAVLKFGLRIGTYTPAPSGDSAAYIAQVYLKDTSAADKVVAGSIFLKPGTTGARVNLGGPTLPYQGHDIPLPKPGQFVEVAMSLSLDAVAGNATLQVRLDNQLVATVTNGPAIPIANQATIDLGLYATAPFDEVAIEIDNVTYEGQ